jgi:DNA mismatch repair protein MutL
VIHINPDYNPFEKPFPATGKTLPPRTSGWEKTVQVPDQDLTGIPEEKDEYRSGFLQIGNRYIITGIKSGLLLIDQQAAHFRILYERFLSQLSRQAAASQRLLYPSTLKFSPQDDGIIAQLLPEIRQIGFEISEFGRFTYIIEGIPSGMEDQNIEELMEMVLENFKKNKSDLAQDKKINFALSLSSQLALKPGKRLTEPEMNNLADELFRCQVPDTAPDGRRTCVILTPDELDKKLK